MTAHGDQWPLLLYAKQEFNPDEPWDGLFRNQLLIWVGTHKFSIFIALFTPLPTGVQAHFYIPKLGRERGQSNKIMQCPDTWHDSGHSSLFSLHSYTGLYLWFEVFSKT